MNRKQTDLPVYLFHQGTNYRAYELLGCHRESAEPGHFRYVFRVWAPNADAVSVVSDMTSWDSSDGEPMRKISDGVWEAFVERDYDCEGKFYKFAVRRNGKTCYKSDPYAFCCEKPGRTASVVYTRLPEFADDSWLRQRHRFFHGKGRAAGHFYPSPLNIYELHLGSWQTRDGQGTEDGEHYLNYREIADRLVPYVKSMGYTHVELLPVTEYPFDGSWGYQVSGYYAPTARFGTPEDFAYLINRCHTAGVGVLLDWVPAHFPKDESGLFEFDGAPLYEYQGADRMEHAGWGTRCFDVGRQEVQSFLVSSALFWLREYHVDGLRVDAVAAMLYLDFDRKPGEWIPAPDGSNRNYEAVAFFRKLNATVAQEVPDALMIAEESTDWPMITRPVADGGLGFHLKWNMGFANDLYDYVETDPVYRQFKHERLTFPMMYAFSEHYILPVSHDEVVHGKKSLIDKMYGEYNEKFACMRAFLTYLMTMPGKKLLFMGTEYAQFREWDYSHSLEWFMTDFERHAQMKTFVRTLNHLYLESSPLWEIDDGWDGFSWICADRAHDNTVIYQRMDAEENELIVLVCFSPVCRADYEFELPPGRYEILLNSDLPSFGGNGVLKTGELETVTEAGRTFLRFDLPGYGALILRKKKICKF